MKTILIFVHGKVQGVYYRQSAKEKAVELGVVGTVENLADGSVQLVATGEEEQLEKLISWCRRGPAAARVKGLEVSDLPLQPFKEFAIVRR